MKNHKSVMEDIEQEPKNVVLSAPKLIPRPPPGGTLINHLVKEKFIKRSSLNE
jgi:hypothetical protein